MDRRDDKLMRHGRRRPEGRGREREIWVMRRTSIGSRDLRGSGSDGSVGSTGNFPVRDTLNGSGLLSGSGESLGSGSLGLLTLNLLGVAVLSQFKEGKNELLMGEKASKRGTRDSRRTCRP
jgi:hypothetical protein